ncbi:hypothetical protein [Persicobacter psychrovividus]
MKLKFAAKIWRITEVMKRHFGRIAAVLLISNAKINTYIPNLQEDNKF